MIGKLEPSLESARRNALMEDLTTLDRSYLILGAFDRQGVLFALDDDFIFREACDRKRDAISVFACALNIIGGITGRPIVTGCLIQKIKQSVKTDGLTVQGRKIELTHDISSLRSDMRRACIIAPRLLRVRFGPR
jgi:hypothetical protein